MELEVQLEKPRREIHLHAIGLEISRARARGAAKAAARGEAESETLTLELEQELPPGRHILDIAWRGKFTPGLRGLYRAGPVAVTQFEAADARRVFPCFDEPAFKARWAIQLVQVPPGGAAISNGRVVKDEAAEGGRRTVAFSETPPLSSYLIALIVGPI